MSAFDPDQFLETTVDKANETVYIPVPEGDYTAVINEVKPTLIGESPALEVYFSIQDEAVKKEMDKDEVIVRGSIFLDLNANGALEFGQNKNVKLGKLRDAVGQNKDGKPWSPRMLEGAGPLTISVGHRPDKNDPTNVYSDARKWVPMK